MIEFNQDGSLKLPEKLISSKKDKEDRLKNSHCILIRRELVSFKAPKKCVLHLKLSEAIKDNRFVENIYRYFSQNSSVPTKIIKLNEKEFDIEIGTDFKRCSDCTNFINRLRDFLDGNVIEEKGSCSYEAFRFNDFE